MRTDTDVFKDFRLNATAFRLFHKASSVGEKRGTLASVAAILLSYLTILIFVSSAQAAHCKSWPKPGVNWSECNKSRLMLAGANLESANLFNANFTMTDLRDANLSFANLEKTKLVRASLAGASARKATFARAEAHRASFVRFSAKDVSFESAELQRTDFSRADLARVNFEKSELGRATFGGARLEDVRFSLANLSRADFTGASFAGFIAFDRSILFLTRIEGVDLSTATGLRQAQIDTACGDAATKLPAGLSVPASWPCMFD
ncbi:pentapeptide repeat-containing protein [Ensifer sp. HO-A22]|uniref:Pentapeptide repeat-containing protein n=1 Tax=Ensifer oleiphilus TaxID=2742698 RepID=A0A7Y6Q6A5_9HYPH|nr:pentapeptide repeat-containing protein [Ensifer oleiphilus]NVD39847.1 pentapeptide repeat-containing protein [Ensifer oleiphilus]